MNVGTHSCKGTCLSWGAKAGVPLEVRRLLGYHSGGGDKTTLCYSRDAMSGPLDDLQRVVDDVASGALQPDHTRSGYRVVDRPLEGDDSAVSADSEEPGNDRSEVDSSDSED